MYEGIWLLKDLELVACPVDHLRGENTAQFKRCDKCYKICKMNNIQPRSRTTVTHIAATFNQVVLPLQAQSIEPSIKEVQS